MIMLYQPRRVIEKKWIRCNTPALVFLAKAGNRPRYSGILVLPMNFICAILLMFTSTLQSISHPTDHSAVSKMFPAGNPLKEAARQTF